MWRLAVQYRSPGYPGNLASLQCQLGCLLPQGKHLLTHTHTHTHRQSGIVLHIQTPPSWRACSGMTPNRKCIMNLTNITSLYGYLCTCCFSSDCSQNAHTVCSLEIFSRIPYVSEGSLLPHFSFQRTFPKVQ